MRKAQQDDNDSGGSDDDEDDEDAGRAGRGYGEEGYNEDDGFDEEGEAYDGGEADVEGEADADDRREDGEEMDDEYEGNDEEREDMDNSFDEEEDRGQGSRQRGSRVDRHNVDALQREGDRDSDDSQHSRSSFDDSRSRNMKTLQSSVRNKELPLRVAYEQLDELAANAEKVKSAIERNRALLNVQRGSWTLIGRKQRDGPSREQMHGKESL